MDSGFSGQIKSSKKHSEAEQLGGIISLIGRKSSLSAKNSIEEIRNIITCIKIAEKWPLCAGRQIRLKTSINRLSGGKLFIDTYNAVWAANLTMMRTDILAKLNEEIAPYKVSELVFRPAYPLRPLKQPEVKEEEITLSESELQEAEEASLAISDDNIRESYKKFIIMDMIRRKEKFSSGGSICPVCGCAHEKKGICLYCKLNYHPDDNSEDAMQNAYSAGKNFPETNIEE